MESRKAFLEYLEVALCLMCGEFMNVYGELEFSNPPPTVAPNPPEVSRHKKTFAV